MLQSLKTPHKKINKHQTISTLYVAQNHMIAKLNENKNKNQNQNNSTLHTRKTTNVCASLRASPDSHFVCVSECWIARRNRCNERKRRQEEPLNSMYSSKRERVAANVFKHTHTNAKHVDEVKQRRWFIFYPPIQSHRSSQLMHAASTTPQLPPTATTRWNPQQ